MQPTARELERQQRKEIEDIRRGEKAYFEALEHKDPSSLPSGKRLMREIIPALTDAIAAHQEECLQAIKQNGGKRMPYLWVIQTVKAQTLAFLTLDAALRAEIGNATDTKSLHLTAVAARLGKAVRDHSEVKELADRDGLDVLAALKKRFKTVNRMTWSRWKAKVGAIRQTWTKETIVHLGAALLGQLLAVAPEHFRTDHRRMAGGRTQLFFTLTPQSREVVDDVEQRRAIAMPHYLPMVIRPLDWRYAASLSRMPPGENENSTAPHSVGKLEGGYVIHRLDFIRTGREEHTKALEGAVSARDLDAANRIQSTGWAINQFIYDVMSEAWANGQRIGKLETGDMLPHGQLTDEAFAGLTKEEKSEHCRKRLAIHKENDRRKSRFNAVVDCLAVAREYRDEPVFYYPHVQDFRHRVYPVPVRGPHPQGDDMAKSLLHFAEGKPLGDTGEFWLRVHAANCAGKDKLTLEERVAWTFDHTDQILAYAQAPLKSTAWTEMASPWCFLAACHELALIQSATTAASDFISHLPVALDGSCNGIQHLSAMGLDPIGAQATNLRPGERQDIYTLVKERVESIVATHAATGDAIASAWLNTISRQTVKRAVMTTPYGVTIRGIRDQLLDDGLVPDNDGKAADYMRDCICEALSGTIVAAKDIMGWLQTCAAALGKAGLPLRWETPSGSRCAQAYHTTTATVVRTLCGSLTLLQEDAKSTLKPAKQALASAPNIVHSFDAAHLALTVTAGAERGISHWATVHDSFATHAANTQALCSVLREQFVMIYKEDWLKRLHDGFQAYAPHVQLPPPPTRGDFDIEEVLRSDFFFS
jgi:DNA-directed RNA polymerase, mitochondrial